MKKEDKRELIKILSKYSAFGIELALCVVIGLVAGIYLDKFFNTKPYLTIIFLLFGLAAAFKAVLRILKTLDKDEKLK